MPDEAPVTTATLLGALLLVMIRAPGLLGENLERDGMRLRATTLAGVESVDGREFVGGQLEVEHVEVLSDAVGLGRLRDDRTALLQVPAQHDLRGTLGVSFGDDDDGRVL